MFNSPIIDLVILLSFTYFISSLLLSAINEALVNGLLRLRQKNLKIAFENLLFQKDSEGKSTWKSFVEQTLITSPHIECLMKEKGRYPAAIPAASFISAIVGIIGSEKYTAAGLKDAIKTSVLPVDFQKILLDLHAQSIGDLEVFEKKMETFYTDAMDRAGGWYKKKIKYWLFGLGLLMAICMNIDTIKICRKAFTDRQALKSTVDKISNKTSAYQLQTDSLTNTYTLKRMDSTGKEVSKMTIQNPKSVDPTLTELKTLNQSTQDIKDLRGDYEEVTGYVLGYASWPEASKQWFGQHNDSNGDRILTFLLKLLGVIITAFALQLGSDYWFGLMTKSVNIRNTGTNSDKQKN